MTAENITAVQTAFTDAIGDMSAPVIAIMTAGLGLTVIFAVYKLAAKAFKRSTN
ncbi:major capsid protein [Acetobacterium sp. KB-1]|jgi:hypothetical protein|uniref:major capsid protein n=1 Tax=Acetobacterium sp. KB-1 TaxID=2184575 RepID=UPI0013A6DB22|nr:major capsid protein [Acetobacterium sp. KB-1]